jgi:hypothetical protein
MYCYIVAFEVKDPVKLASLKEGMKTYGTYCPINATTWAIVSSTSAVEIRDRLTNLLDPTDRFFVVRSGVEAAWKNPYGIGNTEWLKKNL